jgi:proline dehydrogenase
MSLFDRLVKIGLPLVPKFIVGTVAKRYVAGERLSDAVRVIRELNAEGCMATVDVLGEEVHDSSRATAAVEHYRHLLDEIHEQQLDANISVKPTMLGLKIDEELFCDNITSIVERAAELDNFVRIDMEDSSCTEPTVRVYETVVARRANVGTVLQSYMRRTTADVNRLLPLTPNIRICKGIYREPREIAWQDPDTVRSNFVYNMEKLMDGGAYVGIATHDPKLVLAGMQAVDSRDLEPRQYEFQMLLGVDPELRKIILDGGHRLRVYVPFGADWYPYSTRRLRENPTVARHVVRAMFGI